MTRKRWIAAISALAIVIAAALTTAAVTNHGSARAAESDSPLLAPSTTSHPASTRATTTTFDIRKLPHPLPPPADPDAATPIIQIGAIEIP